MCGYTEKSVVFALEAYKSAMIQPLSCLSRQDFVPPPVLLASPRQLLIAGFLGGTMFLQCSDSP